MERTSEAQIKAHLRLLWLKSYERAAALKRDGYCCQKCGVKASKKKGYEQKVEVHHKEGVLNWENIYKEIYKNLLCPIEHLETLCPDCHRLHE